MDTTVVTDTMRPEVAVVSPAARPTLEMLRQYVLNPERYYIRFGKKDYALNDPALPEARVEDFFRGVLMRQRAVK